MKIHPLEGSTKASAPLVPLGAEVAQELEGASSRNLLGVEDADRPVSARILPAQPPSSEADG